MLKSKFNDIKTEVRSNLYYRDQ